MFITGFIIEKYYYEKYSSSIQSDYYYINLSSSYFLNLRVDANSSTGSNKFKNKFIGGCKNNALTNISQPGKPNIEGGGGGGGGI